MSQGTMLIAGVDEAGRGPLAGPVVAAAVILDPDNPIVGLADSKKTDGKTAEKPVRINSRARIGMGNCACECGRD